MVTLGTEQCGCYIDYAEEGFVCLILWDLWIAQNLWQRWRKQILIGQAKTMHELARDFIASHII